MLTPRGLAEMLLEVHARDTRDGHPLKWQDLTVFDVRSLCLGIQWLAEGVYHWISHDERLAIYAMAARLEGAPRPAGMVETPEERALSLLKTFEARPVDEPSGLTTPEILVLCETVVQLANARYPYPLSASARAVHAARLAATPQDAASA